MFKKNKTALSKGFNLIELAIVLAVIGVIVGGIYHSGGSVYEFWKTQQTTSGTFTTVMNMREWHTSSRVFGEDFDEQDALKAGILASEFRKDETAASPFGPIRIEGERRDNEFDFTLYYLPPTACAKIVNYFTESEKTMSDMGVVGGSVDGNELYTPADISQITTLCAKELGNNVTLRFKL